jgi:hypothetical protein
MPPRKGFGLSLQLPPDAAGAPGAAHDAGGGPLHAAIDSSAARNNSLRVSVSPAIVPVVQLWLQAAGGGGPLRTYTHPKSLHHRTPHPPHSGLLGGGHQRCSHGAQQVHHAVPVQL